MNLLVWLLPTCFFTCFGYDIIAAIKQLIFKEVYNYDCHFVHVLEGIVPVDIRLCLVLIFLRFCVILIFAVHV